MNGTGDYHTKSSKSDGERKISYDITHMQNLILKSYTNGTSLVGQWLRIRRPMQGTWVRVLVREDPTCRGAAKLVRQNY